MATKLFFHSLKTINFRSLPDDKKIVFTKKSKITGPNGSGKTSLQMALLSCLTGQSVDGKNNIDQYKKNKDKPLRIETQLSILNGSKINKCEVVLEMKTNKKVFFFNGKKVSQKIILDKFKISDFKKFTASISPTYLMSLPDNDFLEIISHVTDKEKLSLLKSVFTDNELKKIDSNNIELSLRTIRQKRIDAQKELAVITEGIAHDMGQIKALSDIGPNFTKYNKSDHEKIKKEMEIAQKIEMIAKQTENGIIALKAEEEAKIRLSKADRENQTMASKRIEEIKKEAIQLNKKKESLSGAKKPKIPPELKRQMDQWEKSIKMISAIDEKIDGLRDEMAKLLPISRSATKSKSELENELSEKINNFAITQSNKIKKLRDKIGDKDITQLKEKLMAFEISAKTTNNLSLTLIDRRINAEKKKKETISRKIDKLSSIEKRIKNLPKIELEKRAREVVSMFPEKANISIETEKNGKPCFNIKMNNHDFYWLSSSEKFKISAYLSKYIAKRSKSPFSSIFIDNAEMFSKEIKGNLAEQVILATVSSSNSLTVNDKEI